MTEEQWIREHATVVDGEATEESMGHHDSEIMDDRSID
jgi:hypothetical protein